MIPINPIDKDKTTEFPNLLPYPHNIGSIMVKPDDVGKLKSRALSAMYEQTDTQLLQIQKQVELLLAQAHHIKNKITISQKIYGAKLSFEPFVGKVYHLYKKQEDYVLMLIGPDEWGKSKKDTLEFIESVKLMSDHTWESVYQKTNERELLKKD